MIDASSDETLLVAKAKNGDKAAFSVLVECHQNRLYRFILKNVHCPAQARDLAQESLLQAYLCLDSFNGSARFSTWLTGIALNLTRNHLNRGPQRLFIDDGEEHLSSMSNTLDDPSLRHQKNTEMASLAEEIAGLPVDMRECLILIALEGYSYEDTAQLLGVAVGTVKSRLCRARRQLRQNMTERGIFD
jgi:RNA polymerase sigma-70 factor (ECF subfamily)